jgi:hypothetical protein
VRPRSVLPLALLLSAAPSLHAETTRTLKLELSGDPAKAFAVENLLGSMTVVPDKGSRVVATATVHAESAALADLVRFEQLAGNKGVPTLRVRYPLEKHDTYRLGGGNGDPEWFLSWLGLDGTRVEYDGGRARISRSSGVRLSVDVEIRVPSSLIEGRFDNRYGPVSGRGLLGNVTLKSGTGDVTVADSRGAVSASSGSGRVSGTGLRGLMHGSTGSGDCDVSDFDGQDVRCKTGSGDVHMTRLKTLRVAAGTGSGNVDVTATDAEQLDAKTGSGDVRLDAPGVRLQRITAKTGSGNVSLKLAQGAAFDLRARTGSGDVESRAGGAEPVREGRRVVGYRRGQGGAQIDVTTGSGDVVVE